MNATYKFQELMDNGNYKQIITYFLNHGNYYNIYICIYIIYIYATTEKLKLTSLAWIQIII